MTIRILDQAEHDLINGCRFYESQRAGLGDYFLDSLSSDIDSLILYAGVHSIHYGYYRLLSRRFPYAVYYKISEDVINVWAILDCRRDPVGIEKRLSYE